MLLKFITLSALFVSTFATIKDCNTASVFRPTQLAVYPDPPVPGQPVKLTLIFDNPGPQIDDGTVTTTLSVNFIPFSPSTNPLCDNTKCPIITGSNDRSTESIWPDVTGVVKSKITWNGPNNEQLLCIDTAFKVPTSNFWDIFKNAKNLYYKNKDEVNTLYKTLKTLAEKNNLRGIINSIMSEESNYKSSEDGSEYNEAEGVKLFG
jgi:hypothetical protein